MNRTMNIFMIYRKKYNRTVTRCNIFSKDISKFISIARKNEPYAVLVSFYNIRTKS